MPSPLGPESSVFAPTAQDQASTLPGANLTVAGGAAGTTSLAGAGGNVVLEGGASGVASVAGHIILLGLPAANPSIKGALYGPTVAGAVSISAG